jgi:hypothetical protein
VEFNPNTVAQRLQKLCRKRLIRPHHLAVGLTLLWSCRAPGRDAAQVSYTRLAELAGVGRNSAVEAVRRLRALGVLAREKTWLRVSWGLGIAIRQGRNIYRWIASASEFALWDASQVPVKKERRIEREGEARPRPLPKGLRALNEALASLGARVAAANRVESTFAPRSRY